jgi:hypothetical protein
MHHLMHEHDFKMLTQPHVTPHLLHGHLIDDGKYDMTGITIGDSHHPPTPMVTKCLN